MANFSLTTDLDSFPITRQELFNMWADAGLDPLTQDDFSDEIAPITIASDFSDAPTNPLPGQLLYHRIDNLVYCWHDEVDNTGVSLWLAIGPDRFDIACLADEAIPAGYPCQLTYDSRVIVATGGHGQVFPIGMNQSGINDMSKINDGPVYGGETALTDSWIRVGVDGIMAAKVDFASSSPSEGMVDMTRRLICIDPDPARKGSAAEAGLFNSAGALRYNPIGVSVDNAVQASSGVRVTEPSYFFKIIFNPRQYIAYEELGDL